MRDQTKQKVGVVLDYVNEHIEQNGYPPSVREICAALGYKSTSTAHIYLKALEREGKIIKSPSKPRTLRVMQKGDETAKKRPDRQSAARAGVPGAAAAESAHTSVMLPSGSARMSARLQQDGEQGAGSKAAPPNAAGGAASAASAAMAIEKEETVYVPVVGRVTAGRPILAVENIEYTFPVPSFFVNNANVFMLKVEGDSMTNAGIFDRDYILVKHQPTAQNGDIVVALIDDEATVKTFYRERNRIRLQPENERYSPIYATNNCTVIGKVIGLFRKM